MVIQSMMVGKGTQTHTSCSQRKHTHIIIANMITASSCIQRAKHASSFGTILAKRCICATSPKSAALQHCCWTEHDSCLQFTYWKRHHLDQLVQLHHSRCRQAPIQGLVVQHIACSSSPFTACQQPSVVHRQVLQWDEHDSASPQVWVTPSRLGHALRFGLRSNV
eukprot:scaffold21791_cov21-Tisochrysis_lutea.AAC.2